MHAARATVFAVASLLALCALAPTRSAAAASRIDVPIAQTVLPNGDIRYSVPLSVGGGPPLQAALDTGSFGLRVMARALTVVQYEPTTMERQYGFGGGARFNGILAKASVTIGGVAPDAPVLIQLIQSVDCMPQKPKCPAARLSAKDYGIAGDGFAGAGFDAILGISMRRAPEDAGANNPLPSLGDGQWIVELPRPGDTAAGHLVVNPTAEETAGFTQIRLDPQPGGTADMPGWKDAALSGCIVKEQAQDELCARTWLDTGAPGVNVESSKVTSRSAWPAGTRVRLRLNGGDSPVDVRFTVGEDMASKVRLVPAQNGDRIAAGSLPYYSYRVLYDQKNGVIGLKSREDR